MALTRDTLGFAIKATYAEIDGSKIDLFKDPATDDGTKKSAKGCVGVLNTVDGMYMVDEQPFRAEPPINDMLQPVFKDGKLLIETSLAEIRQRMYGDNF